MKHNAARVETAPSDEANVLRLPSGAEARLVPGAIELRRANGALVVRYTGDHAEIFAPGGDVTLAAPKGRVVLRAGLGVSIDAGESLAVTAREGKLELGQATLVARDIVSRAESALSVVGRYQLSAERILEQARDVFRDVKGLLQTRIGRARTLVAETHTLHARRNVQVSEEETRIDGKEILLG